MTEPPRSHHERVVLVVDDEPASLRAVRRALMDDCEVLMAASAAEALEVLAAHSVALVVADQRMPGTSGTEFLAQTVERYPDLVRIMLTGYADVEALREAINSGRVYHCLTKPWETRELRQVVRRGLERYEGERERRRLLCELQRAYMQVQREAEQKGRLLAITAHELGTPLHILLNATDLALEAELSGAGRAWIETARRAGHWLARGVAQMTAAARLREPRLRLHREPLDLRQLLAELADELRRAVRQRDLEITLAAGPALPALALDRRWMQRAFWNLLTNAVRFTPDGGFVCVEVRDEGDCVAALVRDSGIGIAAEHLGEIFEPFSVASGDPLLHGSGLFEFGARGLGLGLAIARQVAEAHGGTIGVVSVPAQGSCFTMRVPKLTTPRRTDCAPV